MNLVGEKIVEASRERIGLPFRHHYKPDNLCNYGSVTLAACMISGMDSNGYDCSGLVIASYCQVFGIEVTKWPMGYRHLNQLNSLAQIAAPTPGDAILYYQKSSRTHVGIFVSDDVVVHASGISNLVEEGSVNGDIVDTRVIPISRFFEILE